MLEKKDERFYFFGLNLVATPWVQSRCPDNWSNFTRRICRSTDYDSSFLLSIFQLIFQIIFKIRNNLFYLKIYACIRNILKISIKNNSLYYAIKVSRILLSRSNFVASAPFRTLSKTIMKNFHPLEVAVS